jgi:hypothetical protein
MKIDHDLDILRQREDFLALCAKLKAQRKEKN